MLHMKPKKSPPAKGQGTLFSFFSKKDVGTPSNSPFNQLDQVTNNATAAPKKQTSSPAPIEEASFAAPSTKNASIEVGEVVEELIGKRIRVFWRDDNNWYFGKVAAFSPRDGKHLVIYDDGDKEKLVLAKEKVRSTPIDLQP